MSNNDALHRLINRHTSVFDGLVNRIPFLVYTNADDRDEQTAKVTDSARKDGPPGALMTTCGAIRLSSIRQRAKTGPVQRSKRKRRPTDPVGETKSNHHPGGVTDSASRAELQQKIQSRIEALRNQQKEKEEESRSRKKKRLNQRSVVEEDSPPLVEHCPTPDETSSEFPRSNLVLHASKKGGPKVHKRGSKVRKLEAALKQIKEQKRELQALPEGSRQQKEHEQAIQRAMDRASGVKVKTDEGRIEKTLKSMRKKKSKSKAEWERRKEHLEETQADRQEKRKANIALYRTKAGKAALQSERDKRKNETAKKEKSPKEKVARKPGDSQYKQSQARSAESGF